jgi:plasmid stability protein
MTSVQIKDVPEETHRVLRQRAAAAHQSLQEYLRAKLIEDASRPTMAEVLARAAEHTGGSISFEVAAELVRSDRDSR